MKLKILIGLAAIAAALFATDKPKPAGKEVTVSWYGEKYRGKPTASGELFDPDKLTAAHRTLPFGPKVRGPRGPCVKGRELDLSREAFSRLASCEAGLLKVKITILKND